MRGASLAESSALVAVLELKSFTKAAKLLGLSTPRVSDMVRRGAPGRAARRAHHALGRADRRG